MLDMKKANVNISDFNFIYYFKQCSETLQKSLSKTVQI